MDDNGKLTEVKEAMLLLDDRLEMLSNQCNELKTAFSKNGLKGPDTRQLHSLRQDIVSDIRLSLLRENTNAKSEKELLFKQLKWLSGLALSVVLLTSISQWLFIQFYKPPVQFTQATVVGQLLFKAMSKMEPLQKTQLMTALAKEMTGYKSIKP